jgi:HTH-type transcriptional regulator/antitoxin HigA
MMIRSIHTKADHAAALDRIETLWDARPGTPAHDELEVFGIRVAAYEDVHWPILPPDPVANGVILTSAGSAD